MPHPCVVGRHDASQRDAAPMLQPRSANNTCGGPMPQRAVERWHVDGGHNERPILNLGAVILRAYGTHAFSRQAIGRDHFRELDHMRG
jgi:hypothetical protein